MEILPQDDHEFLVRIRGAEPRVRVTPDVLRRVSASVTDEARVVELTVDWLLERQQAADLPQLIDLDDIADAYDDYVDDIDKLLTAT